MNVRVIDGDRSLPAGHPHPQASETARRIATEGTILRARPKPG